MSLEINREAAKPAKAFKLSFLTIPSPIFNFGFKPGINGDERFFGTSYGNFRQKVR